MSPKGIPTTTKILRTANVNIIEHSRFSSATWKPRRLELCRDFLTIINPSSNKRTSLPLREITQLERSDLADHSLLLVLNLKKHYNLVFSLDSELYDWQDDIYQRCPLGNYSAPFDFVHKAHIGGDVVSGTFPESNILPIYAEITGGPPPAGNGATPARSRPASGPPLAALTISRVPSSPHQLKLPSPDTLEGLFLTKQTGAGVFARWIWRERRVTLNETSLVLKASGAMETIPLASLTCIEPDPKRQNCLVIQYLTSTLRILFGDNSELYTWLDAVYLRSPLSSPIGKPTNFFHRVHVTFDAMSGGFTGLPADWQAILNPPVTAVPSATFTVNPTSSTSDADRRARRQSRRKSVSKAVPPFPA